jgi:hypothetical protein
MTADVNGISLHYEQEGSGRDLVLIPGLGASTHVWYAQLKGQPKATSSEGGDLLRRAAALGEHVPEGDRLLGEPVGGTAQRGAGGCGRRRGHFGRS